MIARLQAKEIEESMGFQRKDIVLT